MNIYTDASHRTSVVTIAAYNDDTGAAIAKVLPSEDGRDNATWGEIKAMELAATLWPGCSIFSDSRSAKNWVTRKYYPSYATSSVFVISQSGCLVQWINRNQNIVADWLSRSPVDIELKLEPGLSRLAREFNHPNPTKRRMRLEAIDRRNQQYQQFLNYSTVEEVRSAKSWMIDWLLQDAANKREFELKLGECQDRCKSLTDAFQAAKAETKKVQRKLNEARRCT